MVIAGLGAILFGVLIGWLAYWILRLRAGAFALSELVTLLGVLGGAAVMSLFKDEALFGWYAVGLVLGFGGYFAASLLLHGKQALEPWRLARNSPPSEPPANLPAEPPANPPAEPPANPSA